MSVQRSDGIRRLGIGVARLVVVVGALSLATGCASFAQFETAEALNDGETKVGAGINYSQYTFSALEDDEATESFTVPSPQGWFRLGVDDGFELRASAWLTGFRAGAKYQFVGDHGDSGLDLSISADAGYIRIGNANLAHVYLPIQTGYRINENVAFYVTPKLIGRIVTGGDFQELTEGAWAFGPIPSGTIGGAFGSYESFEFHVEGTAGYDLQTRHPTVTVSLGAGF